MRPFTRLPFREALFVCSSCRQGAFPRGISPVTRQFRGYASSDSSSFLERTRRNLWQGDKPPGQEDPYTGASQIAPEAQRSEFTDGLAQGEPGSQATSEELAASEDLAVADEYQQADTWDGLESVGFLAEDAWKYYGPDEEKDHYFQYGSNVRLEPMTIAAASHQATVEMCLLSMLKKAPWSIRNVSHESDIQHMIESCVVDKSRGWSNALQFPDREAMERLVTEFASFGRPIDISPEQVEQFAGFLEPPTGPSDGLPLTDQTWKFWYIKRFIQLSGRRVPDHIIGSSVSAEEMISSLSAQDKKAPSVSLHLKNLRAGDSLPSNIKFSDKRISRGDHDEDFGRKKAIYSELHDRGLLFRRPTPESE